jgi:Mg2+ and Co2+ transporter CorA
MEVAEHAKVSLQGIAEAFEERAPARLEYSSSRDATVMLLWMPTFDEAHPPLVSRDRIAVILTEGGLLTATPSSFDLPAGVSYFKDGGALRTQPFPVRVALAILATAQNRFQYTVQRFDDEVRRFESVPVSEGGRSFLEETFILRREISAAGLDVSQLRLIIRTLADGRATLRGVDLSDDAFLDTLAVEVEALQARLAALKDDVKSVIELHLNVKSFEMNRFLKLLAVISCLGLIPAVVGGMLGMNVAGNPWPVTLGQVAFLVGMGGTIVLYAFAIKGWLR